MLCSPGWKSSFLGGLPRPPWDRFAQSFLRTDNQALLGGLPLNALGSLRSGVPPSMNDLVGIWRPYKGPSEPARRVRGVPALLEGSEKRACPVGPYEGKRLNGRRRATKQDNTKKVEAASTKKKSQRVPPGPTLPFFLPWEKPFLPTWFVD